MILVTGGLGFIGLHAARGLLDLGEKVVLTQYQVPRMPDFIKDEVDKRAFIEQLDVTDGDRVLEICRKHAVDGIVHMVSPDSDLGSAGYYRIVMTGLLNVLEAGRICGVKRLTVASSQTTYTGVKEGPFREDMPLRTTANNQGEAFKKSMEVLSHYYGQREELDVVAMRIGAIYGPLYHSMGHLVSRMVHAAVEGTEVEARSGFGQGSRDVYAGDGGDMCYAKDCGRGIALLQTAARLEHRCYNIGSGRPTSNAEVLAAIQSLVPGFRMDLKDGTGPSFRADAYMDISRIQVETDYRPDFLIDKAVPDYVAWLRAGNAQ